MKMYNHEVETFASFLLGMELAGKKSRMRTRFVKLITERMKLIEEERIALIREYSEKNEEGEPKVVQNEEGNSVFQMRDLESFNREYSELLTEVFIIPRTEENKEMLDTVREAVLETDMVFGGQDALIYDRWCEIVEGE